MCDFRLQSSSSQERMTFPTSEKSVRNFVQVWRNPPVRRRRRRSTHAAPHQASFCGWLCECWLREWWPRGGGGRRGVRRNTRVKIRIPVCFCDTLRNLWCWNLVTVRIFWKVKFWEIFRNCFSWVRNVSWNHHNVTWQNFMSLELVLRVSSDSCDVKFWPS